MKVKELVELLLQRDQELEVFGYSNHGQTPEKAEAPKVIYIEEDSHCIWDNEYASSSQEAKELGYKVKAILL